MCRGGKCHFSWSGEVPTDGSSFRDKLITSPLNANCCALTYGFIGSLTQHMEDVWVCLCVLEPKVWSAQPDCPAVLGKCVFEAYSFSPFPPLLSVFYGLCAAVQWPPSHPGATQPVQESGAHGPCQNPIAPHLQSINASHSRSPTPSPTLPQTLTLLHFTLSPSPTNFFILIFKFYASPFFAFLWLLPPTTSGFINAEHLLALPLSLTPSLPLLSPSVSLSTSNGKISHP